MLNTLFSKTRRVIALAGIGLFAANGLMADILPYPTRHRPQPIPMKGDPSQQQPVRPYIERPEPAKHGAPMPMTGTMYGRLIWLGLNATQDANYALCRKDGEKMIPVCYIKTVGRSLERFENHEVKATGFLQTMKGWSCPLLVGVYPDNVEFHNPEDGKPKPPAAVFTPADQRSVPPLPKPDAVKPLPPPAAVQPPQPKPEPVKPLPSEVGQPPQPLIPRDAGKTFTPSTQETFKPNPQAKQFHR